MRPGRLAVLVAELADPTGYGRIVRDAEGRVAAIVEHKDADDDAAPDPPVNTGMIAAEATALQALARARLATTTRRASTTSPTCSRDAAAEFSAAEIVLVADPMETEGANDPWQLAQLERAFQLRAARALCGRACASPIRRASTSAARCRSAAMSRSTST